MTNSKKKQKKIVIIPVWIVKLNTKWQQINNYKKMRKKKNLKKMIIMKIIQK